jgi:hypothetical protein
MTGGPFNFAIPSTPVVQNQGGIEQYLALAIQVLGQAKARRQRQAENAVAAIPEGATKGELTKGQQKALRRATGVKDLADETVVKPYTGEEGELNRLMGKLGIAPNSALGINLAATRAGRLASGGVQQLTSPAGLQSTAEANTSVSAAGAVRAGEFERATRKLAAGTESRNLSESELVATRSFLDFVPSEATANQLTGQVRGYVMSEALRIAKDPNSVSWARILPAGVKPADVIGGVALGVGGIIQSGIDQANITKANAGREAIQALYSVATEVSKAMGGRFSPDFVAAVMQGSGEAIDTPAGQLVSRFMDAGFTAGLMTAAQKGDPAFAAMEQMLNLARVPQISGNEETLATYSNLFRDYIANGLTRKWLGYDRPKAPGEQQQVWDQFQQSVRKQMGGTFKPGWLLDPGISEEPLPGDEAAAPDRGEQDRLLTEQALQAIFGGSAPPDTGAAAGGRGTIFDLSQPPAGKKPVRR